MAEAVSVQQGLGFRRDLGFIFPKASLFLACGASHFWKDLEREVSYGEDSARRVPRLAKYAMKPGVARLFLGVWWPSPKTVSNCGHDDEEDTDHEEYDAEKKP